MKYSVKNCCKIITLEVTVTINAQLTRAQSAPTFPLEHLTLKYERLSKIYPFAPFFFLLRRLRIFFFVCSRDFETLFIFKGLLVPAVVHACYRCAFRQALESTKMIYISMRTYTLRNLSSLLHFFEDAELHG